MKIDFSKEELRMVSHAVSKAVDMSDRAAEKHVVGSTVRKAYEAQSAELKALLVKLEQGELPLPSGR